MVSLDNVSLYFGGQTLFDEISFMVNPTDRIGLVGKNGAGKSTMLKMIDGQLTPNEGSVSTSKNLRVGYLKQDLDFRDGLTVLQEAESAFEKIKQLENDIAAGKEQLHQRTDTHSNDYLQLIAGIHELEEQFHLWDGHSIHSDISKVLLGLGFQLPDFEKQTNTFSGGWRMRIELAKLLLQKPDALLLDEPTNHLDIESIIWFEQVLKTYPGSVLLVSHDRTFLDAVTNRTIEIASGKIYDYKASYSKYVKLREDLILKQEQAKKNQDKYIDHTEKLINKFRYKKSKAAFAQSLIKKLDKLERIEVDSFDESAMRFRFPPAPHSGKVTFKAHNIFKQYGELEVLNDISLEIEKGEKIAFVGKNGEGKTTLAKIIAGQLGFKGILTHGHLVKVGYYAQDQSDLLDDNLTVLETIEKAANNDTYGRVRDILGSFLFSGDDVFKKVKVLSGGERARVSLCKLLVEPVNFLVMDEPTNHLDMRSKDILKQALIHFDGTLIVVSHDRDFLQGLSEKVYEFKNKKIREYIGDVISFLNTRKIGDFKQLEIAAAKAETLHATSLLLSKPKNKQIDKKNRQLQRSIYNATNRLAKLEREIEASEKIIKEIDAELADPVKFNELASHPEFFEEYQKKQDRLKALTKEWEIVSVQLEGMRKE